MPDAPNYWQKKQTALRIHKRTEPLEQFLRWSTIQATMWHGDSYLTRAELDELKKNNWKRWKKILVPEGFGAYESKFYETSGNLINQAYHLHVLESRTGIRVEDMKTILEVGSGYGALIRLVFALGFQGTYYAHDLPELLELQRYYLAGFVPDGACIFVDDWHKFARGLPEIDLLIGLYSLCEMPMRGRARILNRVKPRAGYLLSYQDNFEGVNNTAAFAHLQKENSEYNWKTVPVPEIKGNWYLVGVKNE